MNKINELASPSSDKRRYSHLSLQERTVLDMALANGASIRTIARMLERSASSVSREIARNKGGANYNCAPAHSRAQRRRAFARPAPKLVAGTALFGQVHALLKLKWSPQQVAGHLRTQHPSERAKHVSHETIYTTIYAQPKGDLRKDLISCLRMSRATRWPRSRGVDRRGEIKDLLSIHVRPPEVEARQFPGHWEGDLIKGRLNASAVGVLVERTSRLVLLVALPQPNPACAAHVLQSFTDKLQAVPQRMRLTMTYDRGSEMRRHAELTQATGMTVYFCDPYSPWQRGTNENTNGLVREYLPKGTDLSGYSQAQLDEIADSLNNRPRKMHAWQSPLTIYRQSLEETLTSPSPLAQVH
jgi:transposase, IS30 family